MSQKQQKSVINKKIQDVIDLINDIAMNDDNNKNTKGIDMIQEHLKSLKYPKITERLKLRLQPYVKYPELKNLIDNITIESYRHDQVNYWIDFEYSVNFNNIMLLTRSGSGVYDQIYDPFYCNVFKYDICITVGLFEESDNDLRQLYKLLEFKKVPRKILKEFLLSMLVMLV